MGWLPLVGSFKLYVSFAEYRLYYRAPLQKKPVILRSLLIVATPYALNYRLVGAAQRDVALRKETLTPHPSISLTFPSSPPSLPPSLRFLLPPTLLCALSFALFVRTCFLTRSHSFSVLLSISHCLLLSSACPLFPSECTKELKPPK